MWTYFDALDIMNYRLSWNEDGRDWPNRVASGFVTAGGLGWHVQTMGEGPVALLLHGTGASTHSWRDLGPALAQWFTVVAPDLPGHGFTHTPASYPLSLPAMARSVGDLMRRLGQAPELVVGHSAGAAILIRMALDNRIEPRVIVSLNGALKPFGGLAGQIFPPMAKVLFLNPFVPRLFAWSAGDTERVRRLIEDTGSAIDERGLSLYGRLFQNPAHVAGALGMMASWDLEPLLRDIRRLKAPLVLMVGTEDQAVAPDNADEVARRVSDARVVRIPGLGHLAHEERPDRIAEMILAAAREAGVG